MSDRFYDSPQWRFVITDLDMEVLTFLDRLASSRTVTYTLNRPAVATGTVPSDYPEINILADEGTNSAPFLAEGNRLLFGFRREDLFVSSVADPWVVRFAGMILQVQDSASSFNPRSEYTAYDPWQYLYSRPIVDSGGSLPDETGQVWEATAGSTIAATLLSRTIQYHGNAYIDAGVSYGGTAFYGGTIESTQAIDISLQQGSAVGEAWKELCDTGTMDIVLTPIWDPINRPGYIAELNIYSQAGEERDSAIFAWDQPSKSLDDISRLLDGSQRANVVQFYAGQGGPAVTPVESLGSQAQYGEYWAQQFFPGQVVSAAVEALAQAQLDLRQYGRQTVTISPNPERSPVPFNEYFIGDYCPVYASDRLRQQISGMQRIYGMPIEISDLGVETVRQMLTSPDA